MISEVPFSIERWQDVRLQPEQQHEPPSPEFAERLVENGANWAFVDSTGHTIAVGGLYPVADGQAIAWTYLGEDCGPHMVTLVRVMRGAIEKHKGRWPLIRATVLDGFAAGERLMRLLGFVPLLPSEPIAFGARVYHVYQRAYYGGH